MYKVVIRKYINYDLHKGRIIYYGILLMKENFVPYGRTWKSSSTLEFFLRSSCLPGREGVNLIIGKIEEVGQRYFVIIPTCRLENTETLTCI